MGSVENIITENLSIWSSAVQSKSSAGRGTGSKRKLYGVKKLRELILDLAVRGLLVPQDPSDEPASVLLAKITAEKEQLIIYGKIKKLKGSMSVADNERDFPLPIGWQWARLQDCIDVRDGTHDSPKTATGDNTYPLISSKNFMGEEIDFRGAKKISKADHDAISKRSLVEVDDILFSMIGGNIGNQVIVKNARPFSVKNVALFKYYDKQLTIPRFFKKYFENLAGNLQKQASGGAQPFVALGMLRKLPFALPPVAEQHRIVSKVDELMALCCSLEQQQEDSIQAHETLVEAFLGTLSSAVDTNAFQAAWQRISVHFDVLFTTEHSINKLKEAILQLAVMGKLVRQDPNDEPASVLLEKIAAKKVGLVDEGKIKAQKPLPPLSMDELAFELPSGWNWVRLQDISTYIQRGKGPKYSEEGQVKVISQKCIQSTGFDLAPVRRISDDSISAYKPERFLLLGDLIWNSTGTGTVGRIAVAPELPINALVGDSHVTIIRTVNTNPNFIKSYLSSSLIQERIDPAHENALVSGSTKQVELNTSVVIAVPVPLPPLVEQHRIVAKVDELMVLCDQLKVLLQQAQQTQIYLTDAVVENAL
jgi:type I restriction enzyme S subunit